MEVRVDLGDFGYQHLEIYPNEIKGIRISEIMALFERVEFSEFDENRVVDFILSLYQGLSSDKKEFLRDKINDVFIPLEQWHTMIKSINKD